MSSSESNTATASLTRGVKLQGNVRDTIGHTYNSTPQWLSSDGQLPGDSCLVMVSPCHRAAGRGCLVCGCSESPDNVAQC